jgi:hypothetical protein
MCTATNDTTMYITLLHSYRKSAIKLIHIQKLILFSTFQQIHGTYCLLYFHWSETFTSHETNDFDLTSTKYSYTVSLIGKILSMSRITLSSFLRPFSSTEAQTDQIMLCTQKYIFIIRLFHNAAGIICPFEGLSAT